VEVGSIIEGLYVALDDKRKGRRWVSRFIFSMSPEDLAFAVTNNLDPWAACVEKYHLDDSRVAFLVRGLLRDYWDGRGGISDHLRDVRKVYNRLARNPANREQLKKPETTDWLNRAVTLSYNQLYNFLWEA